MEKEKGKKNLCVIRNQPRSSRRRFVELSSLVCDRESQPNDERKRFLLRPDPCKTSVDSAPIFFPFSKELVQSFFFFLLFVVSLFYSLPQASSPFSSLGCLSPEALPVS